MESHENNITKCQHVTNSAVDSTHEDEFYNKRENDILYQWRLRRKLEEARRQVKMDSVRPKNKKKAKEQKIDIHHPIILPHRHCSCDIIQCQNNSVTNNEVSSSDRDESSFVSCSDVCTTNVNFGDQNLTERSKRSILNDLVCEVCVLFCVTTS